MNAFPACLFQAPWTWYAATMVPHSKIAYAPALVARLAALGWPAALPHVDDRLGGALGSTPLLFAMTHDIPLACDLARNGAGYLLRAEASMLRTDMTHPLRKAATEALTPVLDVMVQAANADIHLKQTLQSEVQSLLYRLAKGETTGGNPSPGLPNLAVLTALVRMGADPNGAAGNKELLLADILPTDCLPWMVDMGGDIDTPTPYGANALLGAVMRGDLERAEALLLLGADPDRVNFPFSMEKHCLLQQALFLQNEAMARLLLAHGANPNFSFQKTSTPLMTALRFCWSMVTPLVLMGADETWISDKGVSIEAWAKNAEASPTLEAALRARQARDEAVHLGDFFPNPTHTAKNDGPTPGPTPSKKARL